MSQTTIRMCDGCGEKQRDNANGWFYVKSYEDGAIFVSNTPIVDGKGIYDLCGQLCLINKISELIGLDKNVQRDFQPTRTKAQQVIDCTIPGE